MRKIYEGQVTFTPAAGTVAFAEAIVHLRQVLVIQNLTQGAMLYNFADPALGGALSSGVLTLDYDTTAHSPSDELLIFYEPNETDVPALAAESSLLSLNRTLTLLLDRLEYGLLTDNAKQLKVNVAAGTLPTVTTVSTVTTCATLTTLSNQSRLGDVQAQRVVEAALDTAFILGITNNIAF